MDVIADFLNAVKMGGIAGKESVIIPHSKLKLAICEVLKGEGFIKTVKEHADGSKKNLEVVLEYVGGTSKVHGLSRISRPSKRVYASSDRMPVVKFGRGVAVVSTPKGILTNKEAKKEKVGGEVLFCIW